MGYQIIKSIKYPRDRFQSYIPHPPGGLGPRPGGCRERNLAEECKRDNTTS
jgi:hypothetical protein